MLALDRLVDTASRSEDSAGYVALLLESVAEAADRHTAPGAMSVMEREAWEAVGASFEDPSKVARGHARSAAAFAELLGRSLPNDAAVAKRLNVDRSRISQRLAERSLYAVPRGDDRCYPLWQFDGSSVLRGLKPVLTVLDPGLHPLTVDHWFNAPNLELLAANQPVSPIQWLKTGGQAAAVVPLAADL